MRGKRAKQYRKLMRQYALTFGFREPYQVLVDAQMVQDATRFSMDLPQAFERTLSGKVKPMITQCSIRHLYALPTNSAASTAGPKPQSSPEQRFKDICIAAAKKMERRRCNHHALEQPLSTFECLSSVIDPKSTHTDQDLVNKYNYVVAAQDEDVRSWCRRVKGVPLVYVKRSVMIMEPMAEKSQGAREGVERGKIRSGLKPLGGLGKRKRGEEQDQSVGDGPEDGMANGEEAATATAKRKRIRGPKGPNPLSVMKSKKEHDKKITMDRSEKSGDDQDLVTHVSNGGASATIGARKRRRKHRSKLAALVDSAGIEEQ